MNNRLEERQFSLPVTDNKGLRQAEHAVNVHDVAVFQRLRSSVHVNDGVILVFKETRLVVVTNTYFTEASEPLLGWPC